MLTLLISLLGIEVVSRFIFGRSFTAIEEVSRYLFIWSTYLGLVIAIKRKEQIRILMFVDLLEKYFPRLFRICYVVSELCFVAFCSAVFWYSLRMLAKMSQFKQVSGSLEIDVKYAYYILPVGMALAVFRTLQGLYRDYARGALRYAKEGQE